MLRGFGHTADGGHICVTAHPKPHAFPHLPHHCSLLPPPQVLLSQVHRLRALVLLGRFLDMGAWAVDLALSGEIYFACKTLLHFAALVCKCAAGPLQTCCACAHRPQCFLHQTELTTLTHSTPIPSPAPQSASSPTCSSCCRPRPPTCARRWCSSGPKSWPGTPTAR